MGLSAHDNARARRRKSSRFDSFFYSGMSICLNFDTRTARGPMARSDPAGPADRPILYFIMREEMSSWRSVISSSPIHHHCFWISILRARTIPVSRVMRLFVCYVEAAKFDMALNSEKQQKSLLFYFNFGQKDEARNNFTM